MTTNILIPDTNHFFEIFRIGAQTAIGVAFGIKTTPVCRTEAIRGKKSEKGQTKVFVSKNDFDNLSSVFDVSAEDMAGFLLSYEKAAGLDDGERELLCLIFTKKTEWDLFSSSDKKAVKMGLRMGIGEKIESLEEIFTKAGFPTNDLEDQFKRNALTMWRAQYQNDVAKEKADEQRRLRKENNQRPR
jgi:hypothetical protein